MKILLIDPPGWQKHSLNLGLAYLAGAVRAADFDVQILDMNNHAYSEERIKKIIKEYGPKVVGISIKTSTANVSAEIIRGIKSSFPDIVYVAGGPHITLCVKEFIQENSEIDFGIRGEGEVSFVKLIRHIQDGKKDIPHIGGVCSRKYGTLTLSNGFENLDVSTLPLPVFECVRDMDFSDFRYPLLTSRGCPYGCIFCCVGLISGKRWRARSSEDVVNELLHAKENYQISSFEIMDDNFTFDIERAKRICGLLIKKKLNLEWWCHNGLRADRLDYELLNMMKRAGCKSIALGIESGDRDVFNNISKGEKLSDIVKAVKMIKKADIRCVGYFIVGLPGDSVESTKKSVRFQRALGLSDYKYNMLIPYPGSKIWGIIQEKGRLLTDIKGSYHFGENMKVPFETDKISKETMEQCMHLAENQEWVYGESDLINIRKDFNARFGRDIKKVILVENDSNSESKNIEIEYGNADVLRIKQERLSDEVKEKYLLDHNGEGSYFDVLFRLGKEEGCQVIFDASKRRLFVQKIEKMENEYVRGEILPSSQEWDSSAKKYFTVGLKSKTLNIQSAKNGVIYKDAIALPFSTHPQWEKIPCGKLEGRLAFISTAAFDPKSVYTADYVSLKTNSELRELILSDNKECALERIMAELDVLFFPEALGHFALVFSRAKMNVVYSCNSLRMDLLRFKALDLLSMSRNYSLVRKIGRVFSIRHKVKESIKESFIVSGKCGKVLILWGQIIAFVARVKVRNFLPRIARF